MYYFVFVFIEVSLLIFGLFLYLIKTILNSNLIKCVCSPSQINTAFKFNVCSHSIIQVINENIE